MEAIAPWITAPVQSVLMRRFALLEINVRGMDNTTVLRVSPARVAVLILIVLREPIVLGAGLAPMIRHVPARLAAPQGCTVPRDKIVPTGTHAPNLQDVQVGMILVLGWAVPQVNGAPTGSDVQRDTTVPFRHAVYEDSVRWDRLVARGTTALWL